MAWPIFVAVIAAASYIKVLVSASPALVDKMRKYRGWFTCE